MFELVLGWRFRGLFGGFLIKFNCFLALFKAASTCKNYFSNDVREATSFILALSVRISRLKALTSSAGAYWVSSSEFSEFSELAA